MPYINPIPAASTRTIMTSMVLKLPEVFTESDDGSIIVNTGVFS